MSKTEKLRLDHLLVEKGFFPNHNRAHAAVMAGEIYSEEKLLSKPGHLVSKDLPLSVRPRLKRFASRGGNKMEGALQDFALDVQGLNCLDIGSSNGGFTDCLLKSGAAAVTCVDVGRGQLDMKLRQDPRVTVREGVNARYLKPEDFPAGFDLTVIDVSFISLSKILPVAARLIKPGQGKILALIKPQFELGPKAIGKGGVVTDRAARTLAVEKIASSLPEWGLVKAGIKTSKLPGMDGNVEFFILAESKL